MRVLVCGGRDNDNWRLVDKILEPYLDDDLIIIQGGARGIDKNAFDWAYMNNVICIRHPAKWYKHKKAAGPIRNQAMLDVWKPDLVIAFPGGTGTADMIRRAKKAEIEVKEIDDNITI